jgi:CheY-like chemotaxis protein
MIDATTLVVDDEPMVRQLVRRILEPEVCGVLDAPDGEAGLRLIQAGREAIDVVLTDLIMPGIDGFDVVEVLSAYCPDLPVVCMTGYASTFDGNRLRGAATVLTKPFAPDEVRSAIAPLIQQSRALKQQAAEHGTRAGRQVASSKALVARGMANLAESVDLVAAAIAVRARRADGQPAR